MDRKDLLKLLKKFEPLDDLEGIAKQQMIDFLGQEKECFERSCQHGHFTGSCWLENYDGSLCLLTKHLKARIWLQLGGHADGVEDLLDVALREAREESGLTELVPLSKEIFDLGVHPTNFKNEQSHIHYDVRFIIKSTKDEEIVKSEESLDLRWFKKNISSLPTKNYYIRRMFKKWQEKRYVP